MPQGHAVRAPNLGLYFDREADLIPLGGLSDGHGFQIKKGRLTSIRDGIGFTSRVSPMHDFGGPINWIGSFDRHDGAVFRIVATETAVWAQSPTTQAWTNISPQAFSASDGDDWDFVTFHNATIGTDQKDVLIGTNGQDSLFYWDGDTTAQATNFGGTTRPRRLAVWNKSLVLGNLTVDARSARNSVSFSEANQPTNLNADEFVVDAGQEGIVALETLAHGFLVAYFKAGVSTLQAVTTDEQYVILNNPSGVGAVAKNLIVNRGTYHHFLGPGGKWIFDGNALRPADSSQVWNGAAREQVDLGKPGSAKAVYNQALSAEWWLVPRKGGVPSRVYVEDEAERFLDTDYGARRSLLPVSAMQVPSGQTVTSIGSVAKGTRAIFSGITDGFDDQTQRWEEFSSSEHDRDIWVGTSAGHVYESTGGPQNISMLETGLIPVSRSAEAWELKGINLWYEGPGFTATVRLFRNPQNEVLLEGIPDPVVTNFFAGENYIPVRRIARYYSLRLEFNTAEPWAIAGWSTELGKMRRRPDL